MTEGERLGWQNRTEAEIRTFYRSHEMTKIINVEHKSPQRTQLYLLSTYTRVLVKKTHKIHYNRFTQQRILISKGFSFM